MANTIEIIVKYNDRGGAAGLNALSKTLGGIGQRFSSLGGTLTRNVTMPIAAAGAALVGLGAVATRMAVSYESAFAGVIKTTDGLTDSTGQLNAVGQELSQGFRDLAKEIPLSVEELLRIGELGGQLGIARESLLDFSETIAALGVSTNLTTEEAAAGFAQIANVMQTPQEQIENMGSAVVALGNNFATTERDILAFAQRIAGAGRIAHLTEGDIFGIGAAFASVGVEAEAGGTAVQKVLIGINTAVVQGGKKLNTFAKTAGMSASDFAAAWREDPGRAFTRFVEGVGSAGDEAIMILEDLGLQDQRLVRAFLSVGNAGDLLSRSLEMSNLAYGENLALTKEAEQRYRTTASQLTIVKNQFRDVGITIGTALLPVLSDLLKESKPLIEQLGRDLPGLLEGSLKPAIQGVIDGLRPLGAIILGLIKGFADLDPKTQGNIVKFALLAAAAGPALKILGGGITIISGLSGALSKLPAILAGVSTAWRAWSSGMTLTTALGAAGLSPLVITLGAIALAVGAVVAVWATWNRTIIKTNQEGQAAVTGAWSSFFEKQVTDGKSAAQIAEAYAAKQADVKKILEDTNPVLRLFIANKAGLSDATNQANASLAAVATTFEEYQAAATTAGISIKMLSREQFDQIHTTLNAAKSTGQASEETDAYTAELAKNLGVTEDVIKQSLGLDDALGGVGEALLEASDIASIAGERLGKAGIEGEGLRQIMDGLAVTLGAATQEQVDLANQVRLLADAFAVGAIDLADFNAFMEQAKEGTLQLSDEVINNIASMTEARQAMIDNEQATRSYALSQLDLAEALKDATQAQTAQAAIRELKTAYDDGRLSFEQYTASVTGVQDTFGLVDEKSRALASGLASVVSALGAGIIPAGDFDQALKDIIVASVNGQAAVDELLAKYGVIPQALAEAQQAVADASKAIADTKLEPEEMDWLQETDWGQIGEKVTGDIQEGMAEKTPAITELAQATAEEIQAKFTEPDWKGMGVIVAGDIEQGMLTKTPAIEQVAGDAAASVQSAFETEDWGAVGENATAGIADGIRAGIPSISAAAREAARAALDAANAELGNRSPSKAFMRVGADAVSGLLKSLQIGVGQVAGASRALSANMLGAFSAAQPRLAFSAQAAASVSPAIYSTPRASTPAVAAGDLNVNQHFYDEGAAALGLAFVRDAGRRRLNASMGR